MGGSSFIKDKVLDTSFITASFLFILILVSKYLGGHFVNPDFLHLLSENIFLRNIMMYVFVFFSFNFVENVDNKDESDLPVKCIYALVLFIFFIMIMRTPPYFIILILILLSVIYLLNFEEEKDNDSREYYKIQVYVYFITLIVILIGNYIHISSYKKTLGKKFSYLQFYFGKHVPQTLELQGKAHH